MTTRLVHGNAFAALQQLAELTGFGLHLTHGEVLVELWKNHEQSKIIQVFFMKKKERL